MVPAAGVVELVDTPALGAGAARCGGSSPSARISPGLGPDCRAAQREPTIAGMLRWAIVAVGALLLVPGSASAQGESESVTSGDVTATLTWMVGADAGVSGARLAITRAGVVAFDDAIPHVVCDGCTLPSRPAEDVQLVDLDGLGEPEAIVTAVHGCCSAAGFYSFNART